MDRCQLRSKYVYTGVGWYGDREGIPETHRERKNCNGKEFQTVIQWDNMKQPANTGITSILPESSIICNTGTDTGKYQYPSIFQNLSVSAILEDTGHCQNMSIADTGKYWKILENTGYTSIADTGRLATKLRNVLVYCFFFCGRLLHIIRFSVLDTSVVCSQFRTCGQQLA